jgi:AraC family transcriptional regulator
MPNSTELGAYGQKLAAHFHLDKSEHLEAAWPGQSVFAATRLRSERGIPDHTTKVASEPALLVSVAIQPVPLGACYHWIDGKAVDTPYVPGFHSHFMDLQSDPVCWVGVSFDYVHFHVPRSGLDDMALEYGVQPVGSYHQVIGVKDLVLAQITRTLLPHLGSRELTSSLALDQLGLILGVHVLQRYAGLPARAPIARGGLAPWQRRRATEMIWAKLDGSVRLAALAQECGLSVSHFARAFKASFGVSTHNWLNERRIERSKHLMMTTTLPLAEIAIRSGFSDQAGLTRIFHRLVGESPGKWRRAHVRR